MDLAWLHQLLEIIAGGPEASVSARIARAGLVLCTVAAAAQLLTMMSTSWGDRHQIGKSFSLSVLVHLCLGLGWVSVVESKSAVSSIEPELVETPIQLTLTHDSAAESWQTRSEISDAHEGTALPFTRRSQNRSSSRPIDDEPTTFADNRRPVSKPMESPSFTPTVASSDVPDQVVMAKDRRVPAPVISGAVDDPGPQSRPEVTRGPRSRREIARSLPKLADLSPRQELPRPPVAVEASFPGPSMSAVRPEVPQIVTGSGSIVRPQPQLRAAPADEVRAESILKGVVTDRKTGRPVPRTTVRFDRIQGKPLLAVTRDDGTYELILPDTPDMFAITAVQADYLPEARNIRSSDVKGKTHRVDFTLRTAAEDLIAVENNPRVHHLGNDQFEGVANSKFQRRSEGQTFTQTFTVAAENSQRPFQSPVVTFLARGVQCPPLIRINGRLLRATDGLSPADGAYGPLEFPFDSAMLKPGLNEISVTAATCQGDLDDFEFVNIQIRFSKPK
jgi:hypothetical protein